MLLTEQPENEASKTGKNLNPLHKDGPKSGDGSPHPSQSPSQSKGFEDKEAVRKGVHGHAQRKTRTSPAFSPPQHRGSAGSWAEHPRRDKPDHHAVIQVPLTTKPA